MNNLKNYLLLRFNDYEVPLQMSAEEVRELIIKFSKEFEKEKPKIINGQKRFS